MEQPIRAMSRFPRTIALWMSLGVALCGCTTRQSLDRSRDASSIVNDELGVADVPVHGFPVVVHSVDGTEHKGELLAVTEEFVRILPPVEPMVSIERTQIEQVVVVFKETTSVAGVGLWSGVGLGSTLSHGWVLTVSAPIWLLTGLPATIYAALTNEVEVAREDLDQLAQFARFPQGMPTKRRPRLSPETAAPRPMPPTRRDKPTIPRLEAPTDDPRTLTTEPRLEPY